MQARISIEFSTRYLRASHIFRVKRSGTITKLEIKSWIDLRKPQAHKHPEKKNRSDQESTAKRYKKWPQFNSRQYPNGEPATAESMHSKRLQCRLANEPPIAPQAASKHARIEIVGLNHLSITVVLDSHRLEVIADSHRFEVVGGKASGGGRQCLGDDWWRRCGVY